MSTLKEKVEWKIVAKGVLDFREYTGKLETLTEWIKPNTEYKMVAYNIDDKSMNTLFYSISYEQTKKLVFISAGSSIEIEQGIEDVGSFVDSEVLAMFLNSAKFIIFEGQQLVLEW